MDFSDFLGGCTRIFVSEQTLTLMGSSQDLNKTSPVLVAAIIKGLDALLDDFDGRQFGSGGQGNQTHQDHLRFSQQTST